MKSTITIEPNWTFTRTRTKDGTTFAFHSSKDCPGYTFCISNWRLRRGVPPPDHKSVEPVQLAIEAYDELKRVLGGSAFAETHGIEAELLEMSKRPSGLFLPPKIVWKNEMRRLLVARLKDTMSPRVAHLSVPLLTLTMRDRSPYSIEKVPWSFSTPPQALQHLANTGFDSRFPWGITALPPTGADVWVVSKFSQCEVELKWNRSAAIEAEFPWLKDLAGWLARKRQRTPADYARCAKRRCMIKNAKDRREIKTYFKVLRKNDYTVREAYKEIARRAKSGNVGEKILSERYVDVTPRIIRRVVESKE